MLSKFINRQYIGFIISLIAMSVAIFIFREMFLFSKVYYPSEWIKDVPRYLMPPWILIWCTLPVVVFPNTSAKKLLLFGLVITLAPLAAVITDCIESDYNDFLEALMNTIFHYFFVLIMIGVNLFIPISFYLAANIFIFLAKNRKTWWSGIEDFLDQYEKKK